MAKFHITIEVERAIPATQSEANELMRLLLRTLHTFVLPVKAVKAKVIK